MKICVICRERIEEVSYVELHLVEGVASVLYHEKCYRPSGAQKQHLPPVTITEDVVKTVAD